MDFTEGVSRTESKRDDYDSESEREEDSKSGFANSENIAISDDKIHLMKLTPTNYYHLCRM